MNARQISTDDFERDVLNSERPTLVDFYADWCGPCRMMSHVVEELANEFGDHVNVVKVNVDESPELAAQYGVQSIPMFIVVRDRQVTRTLIGVQTKRALATAIAG